MRALLDPPLEGLDAGDVGPAQVAAIDPRLELLEEFVAQIQIAGDRPGFDERLPLPGAARARRNSAARLRGCSPSGRAGPPAAAADRRDRPTPSSVGSVKQPHHVAGQAIEELAGLLLPRASRSRRRRRRERSGRCRWSNSARRRRACPAPARRTAPARRRRPRGRRACSASLRRAAQHGRFDDRVGQIRDLPRDRVQTLPANDVAIADPQRLAALEAPQRRHHGRVVVGQASTSAPISSTSVSRPTGCPSVIRSRS